MAVEELIHSRQYALLFAVVVSSFRRHEAVRIFADFIAHAWILCQKLFQRGVAFHEFLVIGQARILLELFSDFRMSVQEPIECSHFALSDIAAVTVMIAVAIFGAFFAPFKALFLVHHSIGILAQILAYFGVLLQILL